MDILFDFFQSTGFANLGIKNILMICIGLFFIGLAIIKNYEPLLLLPIGFGILVGNIPFGEMGLGVYDNGGLGEPGQDFEPGNASVLSYLYFGVRYGIYPPLIFLGIGAMTDFTTLLSNPKLMLLGAAAQIGIFLTLLGGLWLGFTPQESAAIGIIGGADGPTAIFLSAKLAPELLGPIAIAAYSYMALVPVIQPPIMYALTSKRERLIRMEPPREVSQREKIMFPLIGFYRHRTPRQHRAQLADRHRHHPARLHRRRQHPARRLPHRQLAENLRTRRARVRHRHRLRPVVRQADERVPHR